MSDIATMILDHARQSLPPGKPMTKRDRMQFRAARKAHWSQCPQPLTRQLKRQLDRLSYNDPRRSSIERT